MKIKGSVLKPMRFSYGIERDRCCLSRKTARRSLCRLSRKLRETVFYYGLSPWELQLQNMHNPDIDELLNQTDVLIDGPFLIEKKDLTLQFRGSSNQRIIDMQKTRESGQIVLIEY